MKCDICGSNEAVIHIKQETGSEAVELYLCEECAAARGITGDSEDVDLSVTNLLTALVDTKDTGQESDKKKACPRCGMTMQRFKREGRLGCNECYSTFSKEIGRILGKMYGRSHHRGKYPKRLLAYKTFLVEIEKLKKQLDRAVKQENYEKAAQLRDRIREMTGSVHDGFQTPRS